MEVLRDGMGKPAGIEYLDVKYMRVCGAGEPVEVSFMYEENGKVKRIKRQKRFRKFVQMINGKKYFSKNTAIPEKWTCARASMSAHWLKSTKQTK